jgi:hypothetical protein
MSKHTRSSSGEHLTLSNEIYIITGGDYRGKQVRLVENSDEMDRSDFITESVEVCLINSRYMDTITIPKNDIEMV